MKALKSVSVLGMKVHAVGFQEAVERIVAWAIARESRYVCVANVHMIMEACDHPEYRQVVNRADLVVPDGMPLVWMLRRLGFPRQERVSGPDLTPALLSRAEEQGIRVGFYGSTLEVMEKLLHKSRSQWPRLQVVYTYSPPFRPLTPEEDRQVTEEIRRSGVQMLFVGLGCPRQERWMAEHRGKIPAVMLGVGAAFDFLAGSKPRAPRWMRKHGLEWLFRLLSEPRRLWRRYVLLNPRFMVLAGLQLLGLKSFEQEEKS